ncbi:MAG: DUF5357 family protein [Phormidesmis sp.]
MREPLQNASAQIREWLLPKQYYAWQTFLLLSLFSLVIAAALAPLNTEAMPFSVRVLNTLSWIFLTAAVWWALSENPIKVNNFSIGPWITGIVVCMFLFRPWTPTRFRWALSSWPVVSTAVMALPKFVNWELKVKLPRKSEDQQRLVMTLLVNLLLSSWIMFYFRVQDWVENYPTLLVNGFEQSAFVSDFGSERSQQTQGVQLLENMANEITQQLNDQPWYQTERWLYNRQERLQAIALQTKQTLSAPDEGSYWRMAVPEPKRLGDGYLLTLRATWLGPVAHDDGFFLEKTCRIMPEERVRTPPNPPEQSESPSAVRPTSTETAVSCNEELPPVQWIKAQS